MSTFGHMDTPALVGELVEKLSASGMAFDEDFINVLGALVNREQGWSADVMLQERLKAEEADPDYWLYVIRPLKRHSVTVIQRIQVSVQAADNEHAYQIAKRMHDPLEYGEVFETEYTDAFLQDT